MKVELKNGASFILDAGMDDNAGDESAVGIDYKNLPNDVKVDDILSGEESGVFQKLNSSFCQLFF